MAESVEGSWQDAPGESVSRPGAVLILTGLAAFIASVCGFALQYVGFGTSAGIVALLASAGGLAMLTQDGRRLRDRQAVRPDAWSTPPDRN